MAFFNDHERLADVMNMCSFYIAFVVVAEWLGYWTGECLVDPTMEWYATIAADATEKAVALAGTPEVSTCDAVWQHADPSWEKVAAGFVCFVASDEPVHVAFPLNLLLLVLSGTLQSMLGLSFIKSFG